MSTITHPQALSDDELHHFMKLCIALAYDAMPVQEVPVSALYVHLPTRTILGSSFNQTVVKKNGIRHCEPHPHTEFLETGYIDHIISEPKNENGMMHSTPLTVAQSVGVLKPYLSSGPKCLLTSPELSQLATQFHLDDKAINNIQPRLNCTRNCGEKQQKDENEKMQNQNRPRNHSDQQQNHQNQQNQANLPRSLRPLLVKLTRSICLDIACIVSVEPCIMCTGVLTNAGVKVVYAGCGNEKFGGCGSITSSHITFPHEAQSITRSNEGMRNEELMVPIPSVVTVVGNNGQEKQNTEVLINKSGSKSTQNAPNSSNSAENGPQNSSNSTTGPLGFGPQLEYNQGCMREEAIKALQVFYLRGNPNAPDEKRQRTLATD